MSHMDYDGGDTSCGSTGCGGTRRLITYTAAGGEADFFVPITDESGTPINLALDTYHVGLFAFEPVNVNANIPQCLFPPGAGVNRTIAHFRVLTAAVLAVNDVLVFEIVEAS